MLEFVIFQPWTMVSPPHHYPLSNPLHTHTHPHTHTQARDLMTERPGVATRLLYQLFVALNRIKVSSLYQCLWSTNHYPQDNKVQSLQSMRPPGKLKLERIETGIFQKKLKQQTPRQVDLNFEGLIQKFQERQKIFEEKLLTEQKKEESK